MRSRAPELSSGDAGGLLVGVFSIGLVGAEVELVSIFSFCSNNIPFMSSPDLGRSRDSS